jgi:hypothetical protein
MSTIQRHGIDTDLLPWSLWVLEAIAAGQLVQALDQIRRVEADVQAAFLCQRNANSLVSHSHLFLRMASSIFLSVSPGIDGSNCPGYPTHSCHYSSV